MNQSTKYKDIKRVPEGFAYTGGSHNKYKQTQYLSYLNHKEYTNESDVTEAIDPRFEYHWSTGWITYENGSKR